MFYDKIRYWQFENHWQRIEANLDSDPKKIKQIESEHPDFKKKYEDEYECYVFMQQYYSMVSLAQFILEKFIDRSVTNIAEERK